MRHHHLTLSLLLLAALLASACQPLLLPETTLPEQSPTPLSTAPMAEENAAATPAADPTPTTDLPEKLLFVGNSFTYWNNGLHTHMVSLAESAAPPLVIQADSVTRGGAALKEMWDYAWTLETIGEDDYDVVVLQEDIPETDVATFHEYARKFDAEIRAAGATPVLFMAWPYERLGWISMEEIAQAHQDVATELGVDVAPVGLAWQRAQQERPELDMYDNDQEHPSIHGTYLAVNVVYATIFGKSPVGLTYLPSKMTFFRDGTLRGMTADEAEFLQRIAWETVQDYQTQTQAQP